MSQLLQAAIEASNNYHEEVTHRSELARQVSDEFIERFKRKLNEPVNIHCRYMRWFYAQDGNLSEEQKDWITSEGFIVSDVCFIGRKHVTISW